VDAETSLTECLGVAARAVPQILLLCGRLVRDRRVPVRARIIAGAALGYVMLPVDVVPDWLPVIGRLDDLAVAAFALRLLVSAAGEEIVAEHWDGPADVLDGFTGLLDGVASLLPKRLRLLAEGVVR